MVQAVWFLYEEYRAFQSMTYVYVKFMEDGSRVFLLLYVDDMFIACKSRKVVQELKVALSWKFEIKDLELAKKILGMKIFRDWVKKVLHLS